MKRQRVQDAIRELATSAQDLDIEYEATKATLEAERQALDAERAAWDTMLAKGAAIMAPTTLVHFNVRGQPVTMRAETLQQFPTSFFGAHVSGRWTMPSEPVYMDCDPVVFARLMNYMSDPESFDASVLTVGEKRALQKEANRYALSELETLLSSPTKRVVSVSGIQIEKHATIDSVHCNGKIVTYPFSGFGGEVCVRGTTGWTSGVHEWTISLCCGAPSNAIGVCLANISTTNFNQNRTCTHAIYPLQGKIVPTSSTPNLVQCFPVGYRHVNSNTYSVRLDLDARTVTFALNGVWNGAPTFVDLKPEVAWYPYFELYSTGIIVVE